MTLNSPKCTICHKKSAVTQNRIDGRYLCKVCFTRWIQRTVKRSIKKYNMFERDDRIIVGFSGGKDSTVLLHVLDAIEQKFPSELIAVCIDEGIKEYREDGIPIARKTAKKLGIEFHLYSFKELYGFTLDEMVARSQFLLEKLPRNKQNKILQQGPCAFCGVFRRKALNYAARNLEGDKLATGHNLNDVDQTILLNLLRGDAKKILTRDLPREQVHELFIPRVKPLRAVSERDIILYAVFNDLDYHTTDCPYSIQAMRLDVRNFLTAIEDHYPGSLHCIKNSVETIIDSCNIEQSEKKQQAQKTINRCKICNEPTSNEICQACKIIQLLGK